MLTERIQAQLEAFRAEEEARRKYEAAERQRQKQIREGMERTDEQVKEQLRKAGINVNELEYEYGIMEKRAGQAHRDLFSIEPPPNVLSRRAQRLNLDFGIPRLLSCRSIYPPPVYSTGDTEECGFNIDLGEINVEEQDSGSGWGWGGPIGSERVCEMYFMYIPPRSGDLLVEPHVDFQGSIAVSATDHWYSSAEAFFTMRLHFDLYQHYWDGEQIATIVQEVHHDSSAAYWVDDQRVMSKTLSVSASDPVWIKLAFYFHWGARSGSDHVSFDFRTGANRRIRVEHIKVCQEQEFRVLGTF